MVFQSKNLASDLMTWHNGFTRFSRSRIFFAVGTSLCVKYHLDNSQQHFFLCVMKNLTASGVFQVVRFALCSHLESACSPLGKWRRLF